LAENVVVGHVCIRLVIKSLAATSALHPAALFYTPRRTGICS
jgi:hypothetical protein